MNMHTQSNDPLSYQNEEVSEENEEAKLTEKELDKYEEAINRDDQIGPFTLCKLLPFWPLKTLLFCIPIIQLVLLIAVFTYSKDNFSGWCPNNASTSMRFVMAGVSAMLLVKHILRCYDLNYFRFDVLRENLGPETVRIKLYKAKNVGLHAWADTWMEITFTSLVFAVNLFVVFQSNSALDMVLNSLALEFIADLDNLAKEKVMDHQNVLRKVVVKINKQQSERISDKPRNGEGLYRWLVREINGEGRLHWLNIFVVYSGTYGMAGVCLVVIVAGSVCKGEFE